MLNALMNTRLTFLVLFALPLAVSAQATAPAPPPVGSHAPVVGLRAVFATGKLRPTDAPSRYHAQAGWEVGVLVSSNTHRQAG